MIVTDVTVAMNVAAVATVAALIALAMYAVAWSVTVAIVADSTHCKLTKTDF